MITDIEYFAIDGKMVDRLPWGDYKVRNTNGIIHLDHFTIKLKIPIKKCQTKVLKIK